MDWVTITFFSLFMLFAVGCVFVTLIGLPGAWIMMGGAIVIELCDTVWGGDVTWGWIALGVCLVLLVFGEFLELVASGLGAKVGGGSRRGMIGAIVGSIAGAVLGTVLIPIPLVGTLVGAVIGAFVGTVIAELSHKETPEMGQIAKTATGATIGRILGILGKSGIAAIIWCVLLISPFF